MGDAWCLTQGAHGASILSLSHQDEETPARAPNLSLRTIACALASLLFLTSLCMAQSRSSEPPAATLVALGSATAMRGNQVVLDLRLDAPEGANIGSLETTIVFPSGILTFASASRRPAELAKAMLKTDLKPDIAAPDRSVLTLTIAAAGNVSSSVASLVNGVLSRLTFKVARDAEFGTVTLPLKSKAWTTNSPSEPIPMVVSLSGKIHVSETGIASCFFYMH